MWMKRCPSRRDARLSAARRSVISRASRVHLTAARRVPPRRRREFRPRPRSSGGTYYDGLRLPSNQPTKLTDGCVLKFGECATTYTFRQLNAQGGEEKKRRR